MIKSADLSLCGKYRYTLWRIWDVDLGTVIFVGLNPSTADHIEDDPTIRRCVDFAKSWGYGSLLMLNLFAFRATRPEVMMAADDPIGPENDGWLSRYASPGNTVIASWGHHGGFQGRDVDVQEIFGGTSRMKCLGLTAQGLPRHPLFMKRSSRPRPLLEAIASQVMHPEMG